MCRKKESFSFACVNETYCHQGRKRGRFAYMQKKTVDNCVITHLSVCKEIRIGILCLLIIELKIHKWNFPLRNNSLLWLGTRTHLYIYCYVSFIAICLKVGKCQMLIIRVDVRDAFLVFFCQGVYKDNRKEAALKTQYNGGKKTI